MFSVMKKTIFILLLPFLLFGCSKKQTEAERQANIRPAPNLPFKITVVNTPEADEQKDIADQAAVLINEKDYDKLEKMFAQYRASKESYADGTWKLMCAYDAIASPSDSATWEGRQREIEDWIQARPESVTARIALARFLREYAWEARGSGWASSVTDENWQLFGKRLNRAVDVLNDAKSLDEKCPIYWSALLGVDLGLQVSKEEFTTVFKEAIQAEPDFSYYYRTRAVFLLPRWYGDEGEWERDLGQSADRVGGEDGDMLYAQVVWNIHHYGGSIDVFEGNKISWDRVDKGFAAILKRFPDSLAAKNERFHLAALAGDKEKARKYFLDTQGQVDLSVWMAKNEFVDCANWSFAQ
jgi:hypothetical protein